MQKIHCGNCFVAFAVWQDEAHNGDVCHKVKIMTTHRCLVN
jgi:hypothetical protein